MYEIVNTSNGKVYVGSATFLRGRLLAHRSYLRIGKHDNEHLQRAWIKYSEDSFKFYILETCSEDSLLAREQHWIDTKEATNRDKGYNIAVVAGFAMLGRNHSAESRDKMSKQRKGMDTSKATEAAAKANKGKKRPAHIGEKISKGLKGRKRSDEHKANLSKFHWKHRPDADEIAAKVVANRPQTLTDEHKKNISAGLIRRSIARQQQEY